VNSAVHNFITDQLQKLERAGASVELSAACLSFILRNIDYQTFLNEQDVPGLINDIRNEISDLRGMVCNAAGSIERINQHWAYAGYKIVRGCVKGVIGTTTIIVDITGALSVPEPTGIVVFHAVKSTWIGARMVRGAVRSIQEGWRRIW
jgi:hypothetical protein